MSAHSSAAAHGTAPQPTSVVVRARHDSVDRLRVIPRRNALRLVHVVAKTGVEKHPKNGHAAADGDPQL